MPAETAPEIVAERPVVLQLELSPRQFRVLSRIGKRYRFAPAEVARILIFMAAQSGYDDVESYLTDVHDEIRDGDVGRSINEEGVFQLDDLRLV